MAKKQKITSISTPLVMWGIARIDKRKKVMSLTYAQEWIEKQKDSEWYIAVPFVMHRGKKK